MNKLKVVLLLLGALVLSVLCGFQGLARHDQIPDGNRALVIGGEILSVMLSFALLATLYLIPKANRNWLSYLSAFNVLALLLMLGQCSDWNARFSGPDKVITSADGRYAADVPSDWAIVQSNNPALQLLTADWAGTRSMSVMSAGFVEAETKELALQETRESIHSQLGQLGAVPVREYSCGIGCSGDLFAVTSRGKDMLMLSTAKLIGLEIVIVQGTIMKSSEDEGFAVLERVVGSARVARQQ